MVFKQPISISKRTTPQHRYDHTSSISAAPTPNLLTPLNNLLRKPHLIDEHRPDSSRRQPVVVVCYFFCVKTFTEYFHGRRASLELHESFTRAWKRRAGATRTHTHRRRCMSAASAPCVSPNAAKAVHCCLRHREETRRWSGGSPLWAVSV